VLDELYSGSKRPSDPQRKQPPTTDEQMVLGKQDVKPVADGLKIPELYIELNRAVWQVERALQAEKALKEEKTELDSAREVGGKPK
jgi:hypothetical protein